MMRPLSRVLKMKTQTVILSFLFVIFSLFFRFSRLSVALLRLLRSFVFDCDQTCGREIESEWRLIFVTANTQSATDKVHELLREGNWSQDEGVEASVSHFCHSRNFDEISGIAIYMWNFAEISRWHISWMPNRRKIVKEWTNEGVWTTHILLNI